MLEVENFAHIFWGKTNGNVDQCVPSLKETSSFEKIINNVLSSVMYSNTSNNLDEHFVLE